MNFFIWSFSRGLALKWDSHQDVQQMGGGGGLDTNIYKLTMYMIRCQSDAHACTRAGGGGEELGRREIRGWIDVQGIYFFI